MSATATSGAPFACSVRDATALSARRRRPEREARTSHAHGPPVITRPKRVSASCSPHCRACSSHVSERLQHFWEKFIHTRLRQACFSASFWNACRVSPSSGQNRSTSPKLARMPDELGRHRVEVGQTRSEVGQIRGQFGRRRPTSARNRSHLCRFRPSLGRSRPDSAIFRPDSPNLVDSGPNSTRV